MNRFGLALFANVDDPVDRKIALRRGRRTDRISVVGVFDVQGFAVGFGINRDGFNVELAAGASDAHGDFAAVGDQNAFEHRTKTVSV